MNLLLNNKLTPGNKRLKDLVATYKDIKIPHEYRKNNVFWDTVCNYFFNNLQTLGSLSVDPIQVEKKAIQLAIQYATQTMQNTSSIKQINQEPTHAAQAEFERRMAVEIASLRRKKHLRAMQSPLYDLETNYLFLIYLIMDEPGKFSLLQKLLRENDITYNIARNTFLILTPVEHKKRFEQLLEQIQGVVYGFNNNHIPHLSVAIGAEEIDVTHDALVQKSIYTAYQRAKKAKKSHAQQLKILEQQLQEQHENTSIFKKLTKQLDVITLSTSIDITSTFSSPKRV